jgi:nitrate reductase NapE component
LPRGNSLQEWFILYRPFAWLGAITGHSEGCYILLYSTVCLAATYLTCKLFYEFWGISRCISIICAVMLSASMLNNSWYDTFYFIGNLLFPCIYVLLVGVYSNTIPGVIFGSLGIMIAFYSGHSSISCFLVLTVFVYSLLHIILIKAENIYILRLFISTIIGTSVAFPHLLRIYLYTKENTNPSEFSMWNAVSAISTKFADSYSILLNANGIRLHEGGYIYIGPLVLLILIGFVIKKGWRSIPKNLLPFWHIGILYKCNFASFRYG